MLACLKRVLWYTLFIWSIGLILCSCAPGEGQSSAASAHRSPEVQEDRGSWQRAYPATATETVKDYPVHLFISTLQLSATIEQVGVLQNGDLDTPEQHPWEDAGWYSAGTIPGERGSAVIDGHLDRPGGAPAVFWNLRLLRVGDEVSIGMHSGRIIHFSVLRTAYYPPQEAPVQAIFGNEGGNYLNLITCAGYWVPAQHQTTLRQVVYTVEK